MTSREQLFKFFFGLVTINKSKLVFLFYAFPIAAIVGIPSKVYQLSKFTTILGFSFMLIALFALGKFLGRKFYGSGFDKLSMYFFKIGIFALYSLNFFIGYLQYINNNVFLFLSLLTTIIFSVYFLKSVIDGFNHIGFCIINFLLVYVYDLLAIGLHFGFFYLQNNALFKYYINVQQYDYFNAITILSIIRTGLMNLFSLSNSGLDTLNNFVPLYEFILGSVFNAGIIGFFISYIASKVFKSLES